jgi:serine/threonine-protein kinase
MPTRKIGRYEVIEEIGRGGMATVYSARDPLFNRNVAIKMLPSELLYDSNFRYRFEREAQLIASLEHSAIVPVYDFGESEGQPYFVMRLMTGNSLAERIVEGPMALDECVRIFARIAPALDLAHDHSVVHRDIKPGNILFDQYNEPYLSDFGIAKLSESRANLTGNNIIGTPAYMSPEQARGDADLDGRSDIYSLGAILFEMLTGRVPYEADTAVGQVYKHVKDPIPNVLELRPDLPAATQEIILRAMAKGKFARYNKASDISKALIALLGDQAAIGSTVASSAGARYGEDKPSNDIPMQGKKRSTKSPTPFPVKIPTPNVLPSKPSASRPITPASGKGSNPSSTTNSPGFARSENTRRKVGGIVWVIVGLFALTVLGFIVSSRLTTIKPMVETQQSAREIASETPAMVSLTAPAVAVLEMTSMPTVEATEINQATPTSVPSPPTVIPSPTFTSSPYPSVTPTFEPVGPTIGRADKIAFLKDNEVWVSNLDGTGLRQLSTWGGIKSNLQWMPDGNAIIFIVGQCVHMVTMSNPPQESDLLCANWADYLADFEISPDGTQVALSLSDGLFIIPYDLNLISQIRRQDQLQKINSCVTYTATKTKSVRWSNDGTKIATVVIGTEGGRMVELVRVLDISECGKQPKILDEFPGVRFPMGGYAANPIIQSFGWDGETVFVLNVDLLDGFGEIYRYNTATYKYDKVFPLGNQCCFRDFQWSPDGSYILFAFEDNQMADETQLYYIPYNTIGSGIQYTPIPLGSNFWNRAEHPQPALRPSK